MNKQDRDYWAKAWKYANCEKTLLENLNRNGCNDRDECRGCIYEIPIEEFLEFVAEEIERLPR